MTNGPTAQQPSDDHFEQHLRELRPVAPRALAIPPYRTPWTTLAIAAFLLLAAWAWFFERQSRQSTVQHLLAQPVTIGRLNAALRDNDETLNRLLDETSPNILPHGQHGTVLYELGKE